MSRLAFAILLTALALGLVACAPTYGKRGALGFAYGAEDKIAYISVRRALEVGCEAEIVVYAPDEKQEEPDVVWGEKKVRSARPIEVESARSQAPDILEVVRTSGSRIRLRGAKAGTAELRVETEKGKDVIEIEVAQLHHGELDHLAWASDKASPSNTVLMRGGTAHFAFRRKDADGKSMACFETADAVELDPPDGARIVNKPRDMGHLRLEIGETDRVSILPRNSSGYVFPTATAADIDTVQFDHIGDRHPDDTTRIDVDDSVLFRVDVRTRGDRYALALDGALTVESLTPEICETASLEQLTSDGLYAVRGLTEGTCRLEASLGDATDTVELEVE